MSASPGAIEYAQVVGALLANLQSLELQLRMFLALANDESLHFPQIVGRQLPETYMTNWMHLSQLIADYNSELDADEVQYAISQRSAEIRGAIAHGRVFTNSPVPAPFSLIRFSKPSNGKVTVESITSMTEDEVENDLRFIGGEFRKVAECSRRRGYYDATRVAT